MNGGGRTMCTICWLLFVIHPVVQLKSHWCFTTHYPRLVTQPFPSWLISKFQPQVADDDCPDCLGTIQCYIKWQRDEEVRQIKSEMSTLWLIELLGNMAGFEETNWVDKSAPQNQSNPRTSWRAVLDNDRIAPCVAKQSKILQVAASGKGELRRGLSNCCSFTSPEEGWVRALRLAEWPPSFHKEIQRKGIADSFFEHK